MKPFEILAVLTEATNINPEAGNRELEHSAHITVRMAATFPCDDEKQARALLSAILREFEKAARTWEAK